MTDTRPPFQILIVDDESSLLEELKDFLTLHGVVVGAAADGAQALAMLAADPAITVVLTDIRMPGLDGLGLANRVLQARGDADAIEVVLMTGHGAIEDAARAVRAGAFDFLRKPMELDELVAVLTRAHAKALARREAHARRIAEMERLRADYAALQARLAQIETPLALTGETPSELARILSHKLRTPLIPIVALPDMLDARASPAARSAQRLSAGRATGRNPALAHLRGPDRVPRPAGRAGVHLAAGFAAGAARPAGGALPAGGAGGWGNADD